MKPFLLILTLCGVLPLAAAPLTLGEALARVEAGHPWLQSQGAQIDLARARVEAAASRPPAEISLQVENALGTGDLSGLRGAETTLQFSRALELAERRVGRRRVAEAQNEAERALWEERRRAVLAEAARRYIRVVAAQVEQAALQERAGQAAKTVMALEARVALAAVPAGDLARARLALLEARLAAEHGEHQWAAACQGLATLWGATQADFEDVAADFAHLPPVPPFVQLAERLANTPAQQRMAAQLRWRLAQEGLARAGAGRAEFRWNAGLRRVETGDDLGFVFGLSLSAPSAALAGAQAAEARSEHERAEAERQAALLDARAVLFELCQELNHARIEHEAARDEMLPVVRVWLATVEAGAAAGRYGLSELLEARTALFEVQHRQARTAAEYHTHLLAIEHLLGGPAQL